MTVVVGYVPTQAGFSAVTEAVREAKQLGGPVIVVNVVAETGFNATTAADDRDLDALTARLTEDGVEHEIRQVVRPVTEAGEEIIRVAEETGAALVVVGLHRKSPVGKALLGSNAQTVLLSAPCPVLTVRDPDDG